LSVAFTKEDSAETASETLLPARPISQKIDDVNERRRQVALPLRDARYFAARLRTAQVMPDPSSTDTVAFGSVVTFSRGDGRVQQYRIVGEDEAEPKAGMISFVSPVARALMGKTIGDVIESRCATPPAPSARPTPPSKP
jgi:transcription elongation GreA/GreB family factor